MVANEGMRESNLNVFTSVYGCTLPDSVVHLNRLGWRVVGAVQISSTLSIITARTRDQHALMYARRGKICSINFGRPGAFIFPSATGN